MKASMIVVLVGCAVCPFETMAADVINKFDGEWKGTIQSVMGTNCPLAGAVFGYDFTVRKGRVDGTVDVGFGGQKLTGLIQSDGSVKDFGVTGEHPWSFAGKFEKDRVDGDFSGAHCFGKFVSTRKGDR